jgi:hypothetical protein
MSIQRRDLLRLAATLPAVACLTGHAQASAPGRRLFVYEPGVPASVWRALAARQGIAAAAVLVAAVAIDGDRVRFARACLATAPGWIGGVLRHADLLVLGGCAEEEGFRMYEERTLRLPGLAGHVVFGMQPRRPGLRV